MEVGHNVVAIAIACLHLLSLQADRASGGLLSKIFCVCNLVVFGVWRPVGDHLKTSWRPVGDQLETSWRPVGDQLETSWGPLGDHLKTT